MTEPARLAAGRFALYQTPKGGMHLALQVDGEEEPRHVEIPPLMMKLMMRKAMTMREQPFEDAVREAALNGLMPDEVDVVNGLE